MSNLLAALQITVLGMGLVFAAILVLWWMMVLLTSSMAEKDTLSSLAATAPPLTNNNVKAQAAAVAVAIALAEQQASHTHCLSTPPTAIVSAWQLGMRTRQLSEKRLTSIRKPRKVG
jgi:Na+-transporting methylmalonyl-CoA/oxaloacetate decarboxylase gamma subunit